MTPGSPYARSSMRAGAAGRAPGAVSKRVFMGEFGPQQENLAGVINPEQQHQERSGDEIRRAEGEPAEKRDDEELADEKQSGRDDRADPYIAPPDLLIRRHVLEERREQQRRQREAEE